MSGHDNRNAETFYPNQWDVLEKLANVMLKGSLTAFDVTKRMKKLDVQKFANNTDNNAKE